MSGKTKKSNQIIIFKNQGVQLEVNLRDETVWLTQDQMARLFGRDRTVILRHITNIFKEGELEEKSNVQKMHVANSDKDVKIYNLDVIISVGYRVKSQNGIIFRKWATSILKNFMLKGYAVNQERLAYLEKTIKLVNIAHRTTSRIEEADAKEIIKVISEYYDALDLLNSYDRKEIKPPKGTKPTKEITYQSCREIIDLLKYNSDSDIFGVERGGSSLESIVAAIYQTFNGKELYKTVEQKAANLLYLVVKNHVFIDGNKRIAATLFIYFLNFYGILYRDGNKVIDNNMLATITLLVAVSKPTEKELMVDLIQNFL